MITQRTVHQKGYIYDYNSSLRKLIFKGVADKSSLGFRGVTHCDRLQSSSPHFPSPTRSDVHRSGCCLF